MSKRVTDMAGEFGISADEVMGLLRQMEVPVRGVTSSLTDDQVARGRARWERGKRQHAQKKNAPTGPAHQRRVPDRHAGQHVPPRPENTELPVPRHRRTELTTTPPVWTVDRAPVERGAERRRERARVIRHA